MFGFFKRRKKDKVNREEVTLADLMENADFRQKYHYEAFWTSVLPNGGNSYACYLEALQGKGDWRGKEDGYIVVVSNDFRSRAYGMLFALFPIQDIARVSLLASTETDLEGIQIQSLTPGTYMGDYRCLVLCNKRGAMFQRGWKNGTVKAYILQEA